MTTPEPYLIWKEAEDGRAPSAINPNRLKRIARWGSGALLLLLFVPPIPMWLPIIWTVAVLLGYAAVLLIALLFALPLRNLTRAPLGRLTVPSHERLANWCLGLTALHVIVFLVGEPMTIEYLKWSQPRHMIAGNVGFVLLALLVVTGLERFRTRLFGLRVRFRPVHVIGSLLLLVLTLAHILGSAIYVDGRIKMLVVALVSCGLVGLILRRPKLRDPARGPKHDV